MMTAPAAPLVTRLAAGLAPDPARVLARLFMPGEDMPEDHSRTHAVIERVLSLGDAEVRASLASVTERFAGRHRDLDGTFRRHFEVVASRLADGASPSDERMRLIGAYFTHEEAPEGAALTNPSLVAHPDQSGLGPGERRFVLSARAVGEGHVSCLEFRTGVLDAAARIHFDLPRGCLIAGRPRAAVYGRGVFAAQIAEAGCDTEVGERVLGALGDRFDRAELDQAVAALDVQLLSRQAARETVGQLAWVAANNYEVDFPEDSALDQRVLVPTGPAESHGIEDARFVRFVDDDGQVTYHATYTAYDGNRITPQALSTKEFLTFRARQLSGPAAKNKGMALFPRRIGGRYASLSRWDRESSSLSFSDDGSAWGEATTFQVPRQPWELVQIGNCGSPIETAAGWLVLTHGVGPMRTYAIGATLLDLDDPCRVIGSLPEPLLEPDDAEREGYVPNVVYSCGALVHGGFLVLPYGFGDRAIGTALVDLGQLLDRLGGTSA